MADRSDPGGRGAEPIAMTDQSKQGTDGSPGVISAGLLVVLVIGALLVGTGVGFALQASPSGGGDGALAAVEVPGDRFRAQFATETIFPEFSPDQRRYVTRCGPGGTLVRVNATEGARVRVEGNRPATGRFEVEARALPGQDFRVSVSGAGPTLDGAYSIRCLPTGFPEWDYGRFARPPRGMFVVALRPWPTEENRSWTIVFDQDGLPRWWRSSDINALWAEVLPDGRLAWGRGFGDGFGQDSRTAIEVSDLADGRSELVRTVGTANDSHEFVRLPNGDSLVMSYRPRLGVDLSRFGLGKSEGVLDGEIQQVDPQGRVVWRWNSGDHIGLGETPPRWWEKVAINSHRDAAGRDRYDVFHLNSIQPIGDGLLLVSARHTDAVFAISRRTGEVVWKLGGTRTGRSLEVTGPDPHRDDPLSGNHDARLSGDVLTVHDNGTRADRPPRLVRYRIDPEAGTATFLSEVEAPADVPYSHCCGSARRFGTGWLVSWGDSRVVAGYDARDELAFRLWLAAPSYRAVPVPRTVRAATFDRALDALEDAPGRPGRAIGPPDRPPFKSEWSYTG